MNKVVSCVLCFLPLVSYFVLAILLAFLPLMLDVGDDLLWIWTIFPLIGVIILTLITYGVMFWLIVKTVKNPNLDTTAKAIWGIVLYAVNVLAFPVYWFVFIRKE